MPSLLERQLYFRLWFLRLLVPLGKICPYSASHWDQFPSLSLHLALLQGCCHFQASKDKWTKSANAIRNSHCVPALCSSVDLFLAMFDAESRTAPCGTSGESSYWLSMLYFTSSATCLISMNHPLRSKWESLVSNVYNCFYTMPRRIVVHYCQRILLCRIVSALFLQKQNTHTDKTHNCIS